MNILVTNDDGFQSPSLELLCAEISIGHNIVVVAPDREQSGIGQAISLFKGLNFEKLDNTAYPVYKVAGTPSDCVKLAVCHLLHGWKIDLVLSGINPCENAGLSALYSGTVAASREAAAWGIPSISLSVWDNSAHRAVYAAKWVSYLLQNPDVIDCAPGIFWNVNFPKCEPEEITGVHISEMSTAMFEDHYIKKDSSDGKTEFWLTGVKAREQFRENTDDMALSRNKIAVTPLKIDQSSRSERTRIENFFKEFVVPGHPAQMNS